MSFSSRGKRATYSSSLGVQETAEHERRKTFQRHAEEHAGAKKVKRRKNITKFFDTLIPFVKPLQ
jgi:hypothetical protein